MLIELIDRIEGSCGSIGGVEAGPLVLEGMGLLHIADGGLLVDCVFLADEQAQHKQDHDEYAQIYSLVHSNNCNRQLLAALN